MELTLVLGFAFILDILLGDPLGWPHPVRWIGRIINFWESKFFGDGCFWAGVSFWITVVATVFTIFFGVVLIVQQVLPAGLYIGSALLTASLLATRSLHFESRAVENALTLGPIKKARTLLARIVGRETEFLSETAIRRATIETIAENLSDAIVAPIFYLTLAGVPGLVFYKTVNTMDSMVGYKNSRYLFFGRAAARIDDLLNLIPARLTGLLVVLAAHIYFKNGKKAWQVMLRDHKNASSPNAGFPESAFAGALNIRLNGPATYHGTPIFKPYINPLAPNPGAEHYCAAIRILYFTATVTTLLAMAVCALFSLNLWGLLSLAGN